MFIAFTGQMDTIRTNPGFLVHCGCSPSSRCEKHCLAAQCLNPRVAADVVLMATQFAVGLGCRNSNSMLKLLDLFLRSSASRCTDFSNPRVKATNPLPLEPSHETCFKARCPIQRQEVPLCPTGFRGSGF